MRRERGSHDDIESTEINFLNNEVDIDQYNTCLLELANDQWFRDEDDQRLPMLPQA